MRKLSIALVFGVCALSAAGAYATNENGGNCNGSGHEHTAAGSCKDTDDWNTDCGSKGQLPASAGSVRFYANQTSDGAELEACNDEGAGVTNGQMVLKVDTDDRYARFTLNSDKDQKPNVSAGYINVQAGPAADDTGIWCSPATGPGSDADGYDRPTGNPGDEGGSTPDQWVECIPGN